MRRFCLLFLVPLLALTLAAPPVLAEPGQQQPKVGLALSGGGARGTAHVGVLRALEEMGIRVDYIAGTSMGAIVGGLYASGYDSDQILRIVEELDWEKAMTDRPERINRTMRSKDLDREFLVPYRLGFNRGSFQFPLGVVEGQHLDIGERRSEPFRAAVTGARVDEDDSRQLFAAEGEQRGQASCDLVTAAPSHHHRGDAHALSSLGPTPTRAAADFTTAGVIEPRCTAASVGSA